MADEALFGPQLIWAVRFDRWETQVERAILAALSDAEHEVTSGLALTAAMEGGRWDPNVWARIIEARVLPVVQYVLDEVSGLLLNVVRERLGALFSVAPDLSAQVQRLVDKALGVGPVIGERIGDQLSQGISRGEGIPELRGRVQEVFTTNEYRATTIARTETISAVNGAQHETAGTIVAATGAPTTKRWIAARDSRTRATHRDANGQQRPYDQQFDVGEAALAFPGDPTGPPEEVINCRCACAYETEFPA